MSGMRLEITSLGNAAFEQDPCEEVARILAQTAKKIRAGQISGVLQDYNGNRVGEWELVLLEEGGDSQ